MAAVPREGVVSNALARDGCTIRARERVVRVYCTMHLYSLNLK